MIFSERGEVDGATIRWRIELEPRAAGSSASTCTPTSTATPRRRTSSSAASAKSSCTCASRSTAWKLRVPQLRASWDDLPRRSRARWPISPRCGSANGLGTLPAAGMPWFMTVFGRDTLITCLQTLLFGPELARSALEVLAKLQATEDDPRWTPSPARSSTRSGTARPRRAGSRLLRDGRRDAALPRSCSRRSGAGRTTPRSSGAPRAGAARAGLDRRVR